jgi:hypothetical protein
MVLCGLQMDRHGKDESEAEAIREKEHRKGQGHKGARTEAGTRTRTVSLTGTVPHEDRLFLLACVMLCCLLLISIAPEKWSVIRAERVIRQRPLALFERLG